MPDIGDARIEIEEVQSEPRAEGDATRHRTTAPRSARLDAAALVAVVSALARRSSCCCAQSPDPRPRCAWRSTTPATSNPPSLCPLARRRTCGVRGGRRRTAALVGACVRRRGCATAGGDRKRGIPVLVPRWPLDRLFLPIGQGQDAWTSAAAGHKRWPMLRHLRGGAWSRDERSCSRQRLQARCGAFRLRAANPFLPRRSIPPRYYGHRYPQFLPDGRHFLFFAFGSGDGRRDLSRIA